MSTYDLDDKNCYTNDNTTFKQIILQNNIIKGNKQENDDCWLDSFLYAIFAPLGIRTYFINLINKMNRDTDANIKKIAIYISNYIVNFDKNTTLNKADKQKYKFLIIKFIWKYLISKPETSIAHTAGELLKIDIDFNNFIKCIIATGNTDWLFIFFNNYEPKFTFQLDNKEGCSSYTTLKKCVDYRFNNFKNNGLHQKEIITFKVDNLDKNNKVTDIEDITIKKTTFKLQSFIVSSNIHYTAVIRNDDGYYYYDNMNYGKIEKINNINDFFNGKVTKTNPITLIYKNITLLPTLKLPSPPPKPPSPPPKPPSLKVSKAIPYTLSMRDKIVFIEI